MWRAKPAMRTISDRTEDAAALHLRERISIDVDNDDEDDGDDAAKYSAFYLPPERVCTQVVRTRPRASSGRQSEDRRSCDF